MFLACRLCRRAAGDSVALSILLLSVTLLRFKHCMDLKPIKDALYAQPRFWFPKCQPGSFNCNERTYQR